MKVEVTVTIQQTPETVFTYMNDNEKFQQWSPAQNRRQLTDGPVGVGTQFAQTVSILGRSFESVTEVTAYDEPKLLAFKAISSPVPYESRLTLSPTEEGTKVEGTVEGEPGGFFKLAQPLIAAMLHKQTQDLLNKLKQFAEQ